jgi:hypothetical protein
MGLTSRNFWGIAGQASHLMVPQRINQKSFLTPEAQFDIRVFGVYLWNQPPGEGNSAGISKFSAVELPPILDF